MASSRADEVAEILWELKRAGKVATYTVIARRAGFSAGANGRALLTTLKTVRRDWPHLQWWRAVQDEGLCEKGCEQELLLRQAGLAVEYQEKNGKSIAIVKIQEHLMMWEPAAVAVPESAPAVEEEAVAE